MKPIAQLHHKKLKDAYSKVFEAKLIKEILEVSKFEHLGKGELLIDIDDEMTHIPLIISGVIKIVRKDNDHELSLYYLEKGDTCA
ncbi:MAG: Crp/Fnr family transcriptional regulator, partial [Maribacter sp.]|nr:Crp/Fnr family transcriptional regulator [Maribacter sp.]